MKRFVKIILLAPLGFVLIIFAIANRHLVKVSLDPLGGAEPSALTLQAPLFLVLIGAAMLGVVAGGAVTWFSQARFRKLARQARDEVERLRRDSAGLRAPPAPRDERPALPANG